MFPIVCDHLIQSNTCQKSCNGFHLQKLFGTLETNAKKKYSSKMQYITKKMSLAHWCTALALLKYTICHKQYYQSYNGNVTDQWGRRNNFFFSLTKCIGVLCVSCNNLWEIERTHSAGTVCEMGMSQSCSTENIITKTNSNFGRKLITQTSAMNSRLPFSPRGCQNKEPAKQNRL